MSIENKENNTIVDGTDLGEYSFYLTESDGENTERIESKKEDEKEPKKPLNSKTADTNKRKNTKAKDLNKSKEEPFGFLDFVAFVGSFVGSFFISLLKFVVGTWSLVIGGLKRFLKSAYKTLDAFAISSLKSFSNEWLFFREEVKNARKNIGRAFKQSPFSVFKVFGHYVKVAFERHPNMFKDMANVAMPVFGFAILMGTINHWSSSTFALSVEAGGQQIGYISDETVYIEAQNLVKDRFNSDMEESSVNLNANYTLVTVKPNELTDSATISDNIVENSKSDATYACGVYIDGDFICAMKNETDAMQVFNNILDGYSTESEDDVVGFVEDIQYVQGLYPDNDDTIWNSEELSAKLKTKKSEAKYYTVKSGDTLSQIANANGIKVSDLLELNPGISETIRMGDEILVSHEVNYVQLKVVKTEVTTEEIPYKTIQNQNSNLYKGTTKVTTKGVKGLDQVTSLVTYIDGVRVNSEEIDRTTLRNVVDEQVDVGTKKATSSKGGSSSGSSGSYTSSTYVKGRGSLIWPAVGCNTVTSPYGYRSLRGRRSFHGGIDLAGGNARGKTVVAAASGRVVSAGWGGAYGYRVIIDHGNGMSTLYAHMLSGSICVSAGQYVSGGSAVGKVGSTGNSTGPHLHFEVRINGNRVNPAPYIGA